MPAEKQKLLTFMPDFHNVMFDYVTLLWPVYRFTTDILNFPKQKNKHYCCC